MKDITFCDTCVGLGASFITGVNNNPLILLSQQMGMKIQKIRDNRIDLISEDGVIISPVIDNKVDSHFNKIFDKLTEWRKTGPMDVSLGGVYA